MMNLPVYKRRAPIPGLPAAEDQMIAMVTALASELSVARERIDTLERLLTEQGVFAADMVENYRPDPETAKARDAMRMRLIHKIFRPLRDASARAAELAKGI